MLQIKLNIRLKLLIIFLEIYQYYSYPISYSYTNEGFCLPPSIRLVSPLSRTFPS